MFCVSVSGLDSLGPILQKLDITKLKLFTAVMGSSDDTAWGRISPACRELIGAAAEEQSCTTSQNAPMPLAGLAFLCQHNKVWTGCQAQSQCARVRKKGDMILPSQASLNPFLLTPIIIAKCIIRNSLSKRPQELPCRDEGILHSKGVPTAMQTDFASLSCSTHPSGDTGNKT